MDIADLEKVKLLFQKCLDNADSLLDASKDSRAKGRNHIAFHLAVLALEEVGKASMVLVRTLLPQVDSEDLGEPPLSDDLADHKKKLFWAMMIPGTWKEIISPQDFIGLKEIANDIHVRRLTSLYTNIDDPISQADISEEELSQIMGLTEACLGLEKLKEIRQVDADAQQLLDWFISGLSDPHLHPILLSEQSRQRLTEFTGDAQKWMTWLREEVNATDIKNQEMMDKEINRVAPTGVSANKLKWRLKIKLHSLTHSIRAKELNTWNQHVRWVKLYPTNHKTELLVEFLLPSKIPISELWQAGIRMCGMFAVSLNVATVGFFWWYLPDFVTAFYEEMVDLDTNARLSIGYKQRVMGNLKRPALKAAQLNIAGMILSYFMMWATPEQGQACSRYMNGIAHLSKNDLFGDFTGLAFIDFAHSLRMALGSFSDWDGAAETFDQVLNVIYNNPDMSAELKALIDSADALEKQQPPPRPINLENAFKLKALCDAYLESRIRREFSKLTKADAPGSRN